jgi:hypothetical protein
MTVLEVIFAELTERKWELAWFDNDHEAILVGGRRVNHSPIHLWIRGTWLFCWSTHTVRFDLNEPTFLDALERTMTRIGKELVS